MIEYDGSIYYIDLTALDKALTPIGFKPTDKIINNEIKVTKDQDGNIVSIEEYETSTHRGKEIDGAKFEILKGLINVILDYEEETDSSLGLERALQDAPLSYKIAFNTLYNYGIIKEK